MQLIIRYKSLKIQRLIILALSFPLVSLGQQPVMESSQINSGQTEVMTVQPKEERVKNRNVKAEVKNDIKSIDASIVDNADVVLVKATAPEGVNVNFLPLYGNYEKTELQKLEDAIFLVNCEKSFESKEEASRFFSKMAWGYLSEGGKDLATHRFNLAYLLDEHNQDVFWGLGVIAYQKSELHQAIELMQKGIELSPVGQENPTMLVDLASIYIKCFTGHQEPTELENAYDLLDKALLINPKFTNAYMQLSLAYLANNQANKAWLHFHKGYEANPQQADASVLQELLAKSEDPKGIFK